MFRQNKKELQRDVSDLDTGGLYEGWFSEDTSEESKEKTRQMLANSKIQFRLLKTILQKEFDSKQIQPSDFDKPNFDQKRLYLEGYLRALQVVYKLLP